MNEVSSVCVSVIVPAYNASATIGKALEVLSKQNCFQPFEVIVVDDGSSDNTADIVRSFASVRYVRQDNAGPASARNHGARLARGEFLAFTDSDCIPHEDWISQLMTGFGHLQVGVVAGSYGIANPESRLARCIYAEIRWRHTSLMPDFPRAFGSSNFCVKKNVFDAVGGAWHLEQTANHWTVNRLGLTSPVATLSASGPVSTMGFRPNSPANSTARRIPSCVPALKTTGRAPAT